MSLNPETAGQFNDKTPKTEIKGWLQGATIRVGKGRVAVLQALNNASTKYREGSVVRVERIAAYGDGKIFCIVEVEHDRAKLGVSPDFAEFSARVTSVYEEIGGRWRLVHRHADPITSARPAESMLGK